MSQQSKQEIGIFLKFETLLRKLFDEKCETIEMYPFSIECKKKIFISNALSVFSVSSGKQQLTIDNGISKQFTSNK